MKIVLFGVLLSGLIMAFAVAEDITTTDGHAYYAVAVMSNRCDALSIIISHKTGIARIDFKDMKPEDRHRFGYDPEKAAAIVAEQKTQAEKAKAAVESTKTEAANAQTARENERRSTEAAQAKAAKDNERQIWSEALWSNSFEDAKKKYKITDPRFRAYEEDLGARYDAEICRKYGVTQQQVDGIVAKGNQENWPRDRPAAQIAAIVADAGTKPVNSAWDGSVSAVKSYLKDHLRDASSVEYTSWGTVRFTKLDDGYYWVVVVNFRAKNGFGGYNLEQGEAYIRNSEVVRFDRRGE